MKPFNLTEALEGKKVITRKGWNVRIFGYQPTNLPSSRVIGSAEGCAMGWSEQGKFQINSEDSIYDLFMADEPIEMYINLYEDSIGKWVDETIFESEEQAKRYAEEHYKTTIKIA